MTGQKLQHLIGLEGHHVGLTLTDGSQISDCQLVFAGRETMWVFTDGEDAFVPVDVVVDVWESVPA